MPRPLLRRDPRLRCPELSGKCHYASRIARFTEVDDGVAETGSGRAIPWANHGAELSRPTTTAPVLCASVPCTSDRRSSMMGSVGSTCAARRTDSGRVVAQTTMLALLTRDAQSNHESHNPSSGVLATIADRDVASSSGLNAVILMTRSLWSAAWTCAADQSDPVTER